jgi:hypothetical protein
MKAMDKEEIEKRLRDLYGLAGSSMEADMDLFSVRYGELLHGISEISNPGQRFGLLLKLRLIGEFQCRYLRSELKQDGKDETKEIMQ